MIERTFQDIRDGDINHADQQSFLVSMGWSNGTQWRDLLQSKRILIISEAGSGKTHECRNQSIHLRKSGEPAFFVELATLASHDLRRTLDDEEEALLDKWLSSQYGTATFFLDSIDELKLSRGSFEQALKNFKKEIGSNLNRIRVIITTRPIVFDEQVFRRLLPVPETTTTETHEDTFVKLAMRSNQDQQPKTGQTESDLANLSRAIC